MGFRNTLIFALTISQSYAAVEKMEIGSILIAKGQTQRISVTGIVDDIKVGAKVFQGDSLVTGPNSAMRVELKDKSVLTVAPSSKLILSNFTPKQAPQISVAFGQIRAKVTKSEDKSIKLLIKTPTATMGVRGTEFETIVNPETAATSTVTYEGNVAITKGENGPPVLDAIAQQAMQETAAIALAANPIVISPAQMGAIAAAQSLVAEKLNGQELSPAQSAALNMVANMASNGQAMTLNPEQAKAIEEVQSLAKEVIPPPPPPTATGAQIQAMIALAQKVDDKVENLPPAQQAVIEEVKKIAEANAGTQGEVPLSLQQVQTLYAAQTIAAATLTEPQAPKVSDAQAQNLEKLQSLAEQNAVPEIMSPEQKQALETLKEITSSAKTESSEISLSPGQIQAIQEVQLLAQTNTDLQGLAPEIQKSFTDSAKVVSEVSAPQVPALSPETQALIAQVNSVVQEANQAPPGLSPEQAQAVNFLNQTAQVVAPIANPPQLNDAQAASIEKVSSVALANIDPSQLSPEQTQAVETIKAIADQAKSSDAPLVLSPEQIKAIADVQQIAVTSSMVAATVAPVEQVTKSLNDPEKTVEVLQGQYSGVSPGQDLPTAPVKISPAQLDSMQSSSPIEAAAGGGNKPTASGPVLSPVPPGLDAKLVAGSAADTMKMMNLSGAPGVVPSPGQNILGPPPEGMRDAKTGMNAPPAGGFVDFKTGIYVPPPPGSSFDSVSGVFVPPPTMGTFNPDTGAYIPPKGFALDATRGFIPEAAAGPIPGAPMVTGPNTPGGNFAGTNMPGNSPGAVPGSMGPPPAMGAMFKDPFAAAAGLPPQAMMVAMNGMANDMAGTNGMPPPASMNGLPPMNPGNAPLAMGPSSPGMNGMPPPPGMEGMAPGSVPGMMPGMSPGMYSGMPGMMPGMNGPGNAPFAMGPSMPGMGPGMMPGMFPPGMMPPDMYGGMPPPPTTDPNYQYPVYNPSICPPYCDPVNQPGSNTSGGNSSNSTTISFNFN